ncbi:MAG: response regulator [Kangiella sp.]|nr:response regulator [Kangiella sp.]
MKEKLLLIEDDAVFAQVLQNSLQKRGLECLHLNSLQQLEQLNEKDAFDYVVLDLYFDGDSGLTVLPQIRQNYPRASILVLTGYASIATTVQAIKLGADNYLPKPANASQIMAALTQDPMTNSTHDLGQEMIEQSGAELAGQPREQPSEPDVLSVDRLQWEHIQSVLAHHQGNISATARALGMHRRTLQRKLSKKPKNK